ncbi:sigma-70 family RNA polymerase sigma factor [Sphingomonas sp. AR_OL41]|uniref:RNA polymerase sigma factor n=1 Tax=Sphingomonas sp. AR_OL41 TaxID=3042729 RepID=UPI00248016D8|nr:sigma-70 family RNA polymerase sigma factor [Sphingomonas sp. AR_OL41]MDH7976000.1 sigma-70 family RNA polymerase sigma factor [Sphingomonas sp. AR_OL41]
MTEPAARPDEQPPAAGPGSVKLDVLFRDQHHALVRFFTRYRASSDDARDLAQEAFLRFTDADRRAPGTVARPEAFLRQIARNLLRNRARSAVRRHDKDHCQADKEELAAPDEIRRLEARDGLARLEAALHRLKPRTREIFLAHRLDGMSYAEIAEVTGMSIKGVEKQMSKAIAHIDRWVGRP